MPAVRQGAGDAEALLDAQHGAQCICSIFCGENRVLPSIACPWVGLVGFAGAAMRASLSPGMGKSKAI